MANRKISDLTALTAPASGDYLPIVDISEAAAADKNKRITVEELLRGAPDGTAGAPGIAFESDGGNGFYLAGTDTIGASTNGVNRLTLSTSALTSTVPISATSFIPTSSTIPTNGVYLPSANNVAISTNGTGRLFVDASGNVGVGSSSPSSSFVVSNGGAAGFEINPIGTASAPALISYNRSGAAYTQLTTNALQHVFQNSGSEVARIDSSGRLGLGSSSPGAKLTVQDGANAAGAILVGADYDGTGLTNNSTKLAPIHMPHYTNAEEKIRLIAGYSDASQSIVSIGGGTGSANAATKVQIYTAANTTTTAGTAAITVDSSQRVGVGSTSPQSPLHVNGSGDVAIQITNGSTGTGATDGSQITVEDPSMDLVLRNRENATIRFLTANTERGRWDASGRLLVGTSSALSADSEAGTGATDGWGFQLSGTNTPSSIGLFNYSNSDINNRPNQLVFARSRGAEFTQTLLGNGDAIGAVSFQGSDGAKFVRAAAIRCEVDGTPGTNDMPGRLVFSTTADGASSPTERMKLDNRGQLSLQSTTSTFDVATTQAAGTVYSTILSRHSATSGLPGTGTLSFRVYSNGDVQNTNNSYGAISDIKLKENIVDASSQWDDIKALRPVKYNFKPETGQQTHTQIGLIAQEVEQVSPGLVSESPDLDEDGNDLGTVTKSVNYSVLYMKAVKALQEAMERIETLEASNNDLLARVSALESV